MDALSEIFRALADKTRLRVLNLLLEAPACVCEMQAVLDLPQPLLSRHLAQLRNAELVTSERQGTRMVYSVRRHGGHPPGLWRWLKPALRSVEALNEEAAAWKRIRSGTARIEVG